MLVIRLLKQGTPRLGITPRNLLQGEGKGFKKPGASQSGNSSPRKRFPEMLTTCQPTSLERSSDNDGQDNLTDFITMHKPHNRNSRQIWGKGHGISVIFLMWPHWIMNLLFSALNCEDTMGLSPESCRVPTPTPVTLPSPFSDRLHPMLPTTIWTPRWLYTSFQSLWTSLSSSMLLPYSLCVSGRVCPQSFLLLRATSFPSQLSLWYVHKILQTCHLLHEAKVRLMIINSIQRSQKQAYFQSYPTLLGYELIWITSSIWPTFIKSLLWN